MPPQQQQPDGTEEFIAYVFRSFHFDHFRFLCPIINSVMGATGAGKSSVCVFQLGASAPQSELTPSLPLVPPWLNSS